MNMRFVDVGLRCLVAVMHDYTLSHGRYVLMYVVQEIVWIASYFPRHY